MVDYLKKPCFMGIQTGFQAEFTTFKGVIASAKMPENAEEKSNFVAEAREKS
jgi:hypothetical protein